MTDIIERAETVIRLSDPRRTQPHIIGVIAELVKALKESADLNRQLTEEIQNTRDLHRADRDFALELSGELQAMRRDAR